MMSAECTEPRLKLVVLTRPWTKLDTEVRVAPDIASCSLKKKEEKTTTKQQHPIVNMQVQKVSRGWRWDQEKLLTDLADQWFQPK